MPISENDYNRNHLSLYGYKSISKKECCGVYIHWMNEENDKFDDYYCSNLENNQFDFYIYKSEMRK